MVYVPIIKKNEKDHVIPVAAIQPKSVLAFFSDQVFLMGSTTYDKRRRVTNLMDGLLRRFDGLNPESICGFVPSKKVTKEGILKESDPDIEEMQKQFVDSFLSPLINPRKNGDRNLSKAMRFTIIAHSYGVKFVAGIRKIFANRMKELGYGDDDIRSAFKQVLQINLGMPKMSQDDIPSFNEVNIVGRGDHIAFSSWAEQIKNNENNVLVVDSPPPDSVLGTHSLSAYLAKMPNDLKKHILTLIHSDQLEENIEYVNALGV